MTKHYTLDNAHDHILLRGDGNSEPVTLRHIYDGFEAGGTLASISSQYPKLPRTKILLARAFFASVNPEAYAARTTRKLRVICDENVDAHIVTDAAREHFGEATHVSFLGLAYSRDVDIWKHAIKNDYNLIVTKDRALVRSRPTWDLTRCAHEFWQWRLNAGNDAIGPYIAKLPRLVHVMGSDLKGDDIAEYFQNAAKDVADLFEEASSPTIRLSRYDAKPGKHFLEFIEEGQFERLKQDRDAIIDRLHDTVTGADISKRVNAMLKRLVEHEMNRQMRRPEFHKLSGVLQRERVYNALVEAEDIVLNHEDSLEQGIRRHKSAGIVSAFNPVAKTMQAGVKKPVSTRRDPLTIPLRGRLRSYQLTGELLVGTSASRRAQQTGNISSARLTS